MFGLGLQLPKLESGGVGGGVAGIQEAVVICCLIGDGH